MTVRRALTAVAVLAVTAVAVLGLLRAAGVGNRPSLQQRVDAVAATLRCPTCAGLSIEDSTSVLAAGSRTIIREQLQEGRTPDQIRGWFVDRYGQQVLLSPDPGGPGLLVWVLPAAALLAAALAAWRWTRRRVAADPTDADGRVDTGDRMDDAARTALEAHRAGDLDPDDSPAGDALQAAVAARLAAEEDDDDVLVARADARLAAAYRRYTTRSQSAPARAAAARIPRRPVPRRVVLVGSVAVVAGAAGLALGLAAHGRGAGDPLTGDAVPAAAAGSASAPASAGGLQAMASPPVGWTGGMPQSAADWVALGRAYDQQQRYDQAVAAYDMALRLEPAADDVVLLRDDVLVRWGKPADALPTLRTLVQRYPDNPDVLLILGLAQNRTGDAAATATLQKFLRLAPDSAAAPGVRRLLGQQ